MERLQRIMQRHRCVRISARIQNQRACRQLCLLHPIPEDALVVRLAEIDAQTHCGCRLLAINFDICKRRVSINLWLSRAQKVEIGAIED